jgi:glycosyltransferase involved in cell wall biosynthesis
VNILNLCYEFPPIGGGGGRVAEGLSQQLAGMSHTVDLVTMAYKGLPLLENKKNLSIRRMPCIRTDPIICHSFEMLTYICSALPKTIQMVKRKRYDLIHAHFIFPDGVLAFLLSRLTGLPYLITAHGSDVPGYNPDRFIFLHKILSPLWRMVVGSSRQVVCQSRYLDSLLKKALPSANTTVIPNGFDINRFCPDRQKINRILILTRMFERKGVQHFLKALDGLDLDFEIHVAGDGPYLERLKQQAGAMAAHILFHGFIDNRSQQFRDLLETSKIFVLPSESENFPVSLLEAMAAGMAIITTKDTGCEEVVGDDAQIVRPADVSGFREALRKLCSDELLCYKMGKRARKRLEEFFSWKVVADQYLKIYQKLKTL